MLRLAPGIKVYLACQPVDLRRGFDGLSAEAAQVLAADPFSGAAFVFRGKRGDYVKILTWDGSGLRLFAKRLEKGKFVWPPIVEGALQLRRRNWLCCWKASTGGHGRAAADGAPADRLSTASRHKNEATPRDCGCAGGAIVVGVVMSPSTPDSPRDPDDLRRLADDLRRDVAWLRAEVHAKALMIEKLRAQLAVLRRARFGRKSEKLDAQVERLELLIDDIEAGVAETLARAGVAESDAAEASETGASSKKKRKPSNRAPLPDHLPAETIVHEAPCVCPACGGDKFGRIGADEREVLEYVPSHFKRVVHVRPKMSCRACETVVQAPMPTLPIERGRPGPALLAHVVVSKFCDHLPLHRQADIYARSGVEIDRSVMAGWIGRLAGLLEPLSERIERHVRAGLALHADDTPVPVLDPGKGKTKTGRLWTVVRDERPFGATTPPPPSIATRRTARPSTRGRCSPAVGLPPRRRLCGLRRSLRTRCEDRRSPLDRSRLLEPRPTQDLRRAMSRRARPPRARRWKKLPDCSPSRPTFAGAVRPSGGKPVSTAPRPSWPTSKLSSMRRSPRSAARARSPEPFAMRPRAGPLSPASSTTAGSK